MNHRYQNFDWDDDRGEIVRRKPLSHTTLRLIAYSIACAGFTAACVLAWLG